MHAAPPARRRISLRATWLTFGKRPLDAHALWAQRPARWRATDGSRRRVGGAGSCRTRRLRGYSCGGRRGWSKGPATDASEPGMPPKARQKRSRGGEDGRATGVERAVTRSIYPVYYSISSVNGRSPGALGRSPGAGENPGRGGESWSRGRGVAGENIDYGGDYAPSQGFPRRPKASQGFPRLPKASQGFPRLPKASHGFPRLPKG